MGYKILKTIKLGRKVLGHIKQLDNGIRPYNYIVQPDRTFFKYRLSFPCSGKLFRGIKCLQQPGFVQNFPVRPWII